jgi:hypothetical protein
MTFVLMQLGISAGLARARRFLRLDEILAAPDALAAGFPAFCDKRKPQFTGR